MCIKAAVSSILFLIKFKCLKYLSMYLNLQLCSALRSLASTLESLFDCVDPNITVFFDSDPS